MIETLAIATVLTGAMVWPITTRQPFFSYRKVGGLHFWRIGRLGGSVYIAGRK